MRLEIVVNRRISEVRIHAYNILIILGRMFELGGEQLVKMVPLQISPIKLGTLWRVVQLKMGNEKSNFSTNWNLVLKHTFLGQSEFENK